LNPELIHLPHAIKVDLWIYTSGNMVAFAKTKRLMIFLLQHYDVHTIPITKFQDNYRDDFTATKDVLCWTMRATVFLSVDILYITIKLQKWPITIVDLMRLLRLSPSEDSKLKIGQPWHCATKEYSLTDDPNRYPKMEFLSTVIQKCIKWTAPANPVHRPSFLVPNAGELPVGHLPVVGDL
jgi:hypothetical protein